jgi:hypothetical protein
MTRSNQARPPGRHQVLIGIGLVIGLASATAAQAAPQTWNPWAKENPEPYGYPVTTEPNLPLGFVDPADPPALLSDEAPPDPRLAVLGVATAIDRTAHSWFGRITVTTDVQREGMP